ncbi:tyrosine-protein kinase domain-containing protein [Actinoplanes sp. NBRC 101535]|uniref:polysaccharide biosynthesis tyrosine autokinase n=1 Tax=Actinoplanes sp. NBRC 101535 TaxID=3032196 RepID=UPI0024A2752B|nr:tyrosine-protein kinase domain-containing protein [Actinoplanes sp. NBRC 101535]GLY04168.1 hypothetical protein Acsp01_45470 [Actinoplanes sp. NBRC 101535]
MTTYGRSARLLRRYGPWTLAVTAATVAGTYGLHRAAPVEYRSEASVLVESRVVRDTAAVAPDLNTERAIALSDAVLAPVAREAGRSTTDLRDSIEVTAQPGTNVLTIAYDDENRFTAQRRAQQIVDAYVNYRGEETAVLNPSVAPSAAPAASTPATATAPARNADISALSAASLPTDPQNRPLVPDLALGLGAGLLLGAGTALLRAGTRGGIRSREDYAQLGAATVLATVPRYKRPNGTVSSPPVMLRDPGSPAAESFRYLRARLQPKLHPINPTTVLVTSPGDKEGRTSTAANLAVALAQAGRTVVLVDADLHRPRLHDVFQVAGEYGLTTLLDGDATVSEVLEDTVVPRLRLLAAGHRAEEHVDLLESPQLARVLRAVQKHCDVVVLDSAAVLSVSDAIALAALSDRVLLVGDFRRTSRESVRRAVTELAGVVHDNLDLVLLNAPKTAGALVPQPREVSPTATIPFSYAQASALPATATAAAAPDEEHAELDESVPPEFERRYLIPVVYGPSGGIPTLYSSAAAEMPNSPDAEIPVSPAVSLDSLTPAEPADGDSPASAVTTDGDPSEDTVPPVDDNAADDHADNDRPRDDERDEPTGNTYVSVSAAVDTDADDTEVIADPAKPRA